MGTDKPASSAQNMIDIYQRRHWKGIEALVIKGIGTGLLYKAY